MSGIIIGKHVLTMLYCCSHELLVERDRRFRRIGCKAALYAAAVCKGRSLRLVRFVLCADVWICRRTKADSFSRGICAGAVDKLHDVLLLGSRVAHIINEMLRQSGMESGEIKSDENKKRKKTFTKAHIFKNE